MSKMGRMSLYSHVEDFISKIDNASQDDQLDYMQEWFDENYETPDSHRVRLESEYGIDYLEYASNAYRPHEVLQERFSEVIPDEVIHILGDELQEICLEWHVFEDNSYPEFMDELYTDEEFPDPYQNFGKSLDNTKSLLSAEVNSDVSGLLNMLLFASVITALEVYLSDTLRQQIGLNDILARRFMEKKQPFKKKKKPMPDIYKNMDNIQRVISNHWAGFVWHRLGKVERMYKRVLWIEFPDNKGVISRAIKIRHNILHEGGRFKKKEDNDAVTSDGVNKLIEEVRIFISDIERKKEQALAKLNAPEQSADNFCDMNDVPF